MSGIAGRRGRGGLKINNETSSVKAPVDTKKQFEVAAEKKFEDIEKYKKDIWELSKTFKGFIVDQILSENKSPLTRDIEVDTLNKLIHLATKMNNDETQDEGMGNTALCMLLMKCMLIQRDSINALSYQVEKLKKSLEAKEVKKTEA